MTLPLYSVSIVSDASNPAHRLALPRGITYGPLGGFGMEPTVELCEWLGEHGKTLTTIEVVEKGRDRWGRRIRDAIGLRFSFLKASEAVMFKLVWL